MSLTEADCRSMIWHDTRLYKYADTKPKTWNWKLNKHQNMKQWPWSRIIVQNSESSCSCHVTLHSFQSDTVIHTKTQLVPFTNETVKGIANMQIKNVHFIHRAHGGNTCPAAHPYVIWQVPKYIPPVQAEMALLSQLALGGSRVESCWDGEYESSEWREIKLVIHLHHKKLTAGTLKMMTSTTSSFQGTIVIWTLAFQDLSATTRLLSLVYPSVEAEKVDKIACSTGPMYKTSTWNKMELNPCPANSDSTPTVSFFLNWSISSRVPRKILFWSVLLYLGMLWPLALKTSIEPIAHHFQKPRCSLCLHGRDNVGKHRYRFVLVGKLGLSHVLGKKLWTHLLWTLSLSLSK